MVKKAVKVIQQRLERKFKLICCCMSYQMKAIMIRIRFLYPVQMIRFVSVFAFTKKSAPFYSLQALNKLKIK